MIRHAPCSASRGERTSGARSSYCVAPVSAGDTGERRIGDGRRSAARSCYGQATVVQPLLKTHFSLMPSWRQVNPGGRRSQNELQFLLGLAHAVPTLVSADT